MSRALVIAIGGFLLGAASFAFSGGFSTGGVADAAPTTSASTGPPERISTPPTVPSRTSASVPAALTPTTEAARGPLVIHGVGDVNTDTSYIPALGVNGHEHAWSGIDGLFLEDDLTVINLECTPSTLGAPLDKEFVFRCDPDSLPVMRAAGVEVANLANNHSGDHGKEALVDGRTRVEEAGIAPVGIGRNATEAAAPAIFDLKGWRVAVIGLGGVVPTADWVAGEERVGMADGDTIESMVEAVRAADAMADLVVVTIHWGVELDVRPRLDDRERAEAMVEGGADVIFGHHPHRLQPLEMIDSAAVAWSLGNFIWPNLSPDGSTTAVARVEVSPDGDLQACLIPAFITTPGRPELQADPTC